MIILSGADLVLPDRVLGPATLVIEGDRIAEVRPGVVATFPGADHADLRGLYVVPGFIDVHVHGVGGADALDGPHAIPAIAAELPRFGVTAFCPTTVACAPAALRATLASVARARAAPGTRAARVLGAHLESNFLNPEYRGAQPLECLRLPPPSPAVPTGSGEADFTGADIAAEIERAAQDVAIVTLAPELDGALPYIRRLVARGHRVSLGHSAASYDVGLAAIDAGARGGTHLFNRMPPLGHREPGLAGAVLRREEVAAEIVCDGFHVHPAMLRVAVAAKGTDRVMAVTDGTAGAGRPIGSRASLGGRPVTVGERAAFLDDQTLAGSTLTMDRAFRTLTGPDVGLSLVEAAALCSTTPARELGLAGFGTIAPGSAADLVVLNRNLDAVRTYIGGRLVFER